jgi:tetratricopeptide (TPR) repeat protein
MPPGQPKASTNRNVVLLAALVLAIVTFAVFYPVRGYDFVNYDDPDYVTENSMVQSGLNKKSVTWAFQYSHAGNWHPLTWISHMADAGIHGKKAGGHHLSNVFLHSACAALLLLALRKLTGSLWRSAFVAAVFALHPLRIESVAWISERKDVLSIFFGTACLWAYAAYARATPANRCNRSRLYVATLLLFACGLMSKAMLVTLPFLFLLLDFWPLQRFPTPSGVRQKNSPVPQLKSLLLEKIPFFAVATVSCIVTFLAQRKGGAVETLSSLPIAARFENALVAYARYLGKMLWPTDLAVLYPMPKSWPLLAVLGAGLLLLAITVMVSLQWRRRPFLAVGWCWFIGTLVPVIGLIQVGVQSMADRYTYLPMIGVVIAITWMAHELISRKRLPSFIPKILASVVLVACAASTRAQLPFWQNSETLFQRAIQVTANNHIAWNNYGRALPESRADEAMLAFQKALEINPNYTDAMNNLGNEFANRGRLDEAVTLYEKVLKRNPKFALAHNNLGFALARQNRFEDAIPHYKTAIELKPDYAFAYNNLGLTLAKQEKVDEAIEQFRQALKFSPDYLQARNNLANVLSDAGRNDEAIPEFLAVLAAVPDRPETCNSLAVAFAVKGDLINAEKYFAQAVHLDPNDEAARNNLAHARKKLAEASTAPK